MSSPQVTWDDEATKPPQVQWDAPQKPATPPKQPGMMDSLNSSLAFKPNDSGIATAGKAIGQAPMGIANSVTKTIGGIGDIPSMAKIGENAPNDEYAVGKMTQIPGTNSSLALAPYRMGKNFIGGLEQGYEARQHEDSIPGKILATMENYPIIGGITKRMEQGQGVAGVTEGLTDAAMFKAPEIQRGIINRGGQMIVKGTPEQLITRATKPTIGLPEYENSVKMALPELAKSSPKNVSELAKAADALRDAKSSEYNALKARTGNAPVPTYSVARQQMNSIPATNRFEDPNIIGRVNQTASRYNTTMPLEQADAIRMDTNAKLRDFYNKAGGDQHAALSHPETARTHAVNSGIRNEIYDTIKTHTGVNPEPIQDMYGHAVDIGDTAARRNTVFSRQQPIPLVSQISAATGNPVGFGLSKIVSGLNDSDSLVNRGIQRYQRNIAPPGGRLRLMIGGPFLKKPNEGDQ